MMSLFKDASKNDQQFTNSKTQMSGVSRSFLFLWECSTSAPSLVCVLTPADLFHLPPLLKQERSDDTVSE